MDEISDIINVAAIATVGYLGWKKLVSLKTETERRNFIKNFNLNEIIANKTSQILSSCQVEAKVEKEEEKEACITKKFKIVRTKLNKKSKIIKKRQNIAPEQRRVFATASAHNGFHNWLKEHNIEKNAFDTENLMNVNDDVFMIMTRMSRKTFQQLLSMIDYKLEKHANRETIHPSMRLFVALTYLAHGFAYEVLSYIFRLGRSTVRRIVYDVCTVIWENLMPAYLPPAAETKWADIATYNEQIWGLPNCVSTLELRNIQVICRDKSYAKYWVRKCKLPMCLLFACDAKYNFTGVSICVFDAAVGPAYAESTFGEQLLNSKIAMPTKKLVKNSNITLEHYFLGNLNFTLKTNIMRPYGKRNNKEIPAHMNFNKYLLRARRTMDNALGVLLYKWRVLQPVLDLNKDNLECIVNAVVVLHNFTKTHEPTYFTENDVDLYDKDNNDETIRLGNWRKLEYNLPLAQPGCSNNASKAAFDMREKLSTYLYDTNKK